MAQRNIRRLVCGDLYTPREHLRNVEIEISRGKIAAIHTAPALPRPRQQTLDVRRFITAPGLIDVHIQGCFGSDFHEGTSHAIETISRGAARGGCTALLATVSITRHDQTLAQFECFVRMLDGARQPGAEIVGIHLEGPYINPVKRGGFGEEFVKEPSIAEFRQILKIARGKIRLFTIAPELRHADEIIAFAAKRGIRVALGHTTASYRTALRAFRLGATQITHGFNAMSPLHHREPGLIGAALDSHPMPYIQVIADGVHIHPVVLRLLWRLKGAEALILITDATAPCGLPEGRRFRGHGGLIEKRKGAIRIIGTQTLAGSALLMNEAVRSFARLARVGLSDALTMATLTPAEAIGIADRKGSLEIGKDADFAIFDQNLNVRFTIHQGKVVFEGR
jgi:N-acetylglucosamine-6-phosphate deacetylase